MSNSKMTQNIIKNNNNNVFCLFVYYKIRQKKTNNTAMIPTAIDIVLFLSTSANLEPLGL